MPEPVEGESEAAGSLEITLIRSAEISALGLSDAGRKPEQEVTRRSMRPGTGDAVIEDPFANLEQACLLGRRAKPRQGHHRERMRIGHRALEVEGPRRRIDGHQVADGPVERRAARIKHLLGRIEQFIAPQVVFLGREAVPPDLLAGLHPADRADRLQEPDRVVLVHELRGVEVHQPVELPPHRLVLAAMPAQ